ncbi:MAG: LysR family transcriptional regulator substrate-binding protein, partial [Opitutales bacterium]
PKVIARCRMNYPKLEVSTYEDFYPLLVEAVAQGEIDLALTSLPIRDRRVSVETLFKEPLHLVLGHGHRLADQKDITVMDLQDEKFIMLGTASSVTAQIRQFCGDHNFEPRIEHRCSQIKTLKTLVGLSLGVAILPAGTFSPEDEQTLIYRALSGRSTPTREIALIRHPRRYASRGTEQFIATLRDALARAPIPLAPDAPRPTESAATSAQP